MRVGSRQSAVGRQKAGRRGRRLVIVLSALCLLPTAHCLPGCGESKPGDSSFDRSEKAMRDPMHYSPYSTAERKSDMSGARGGTTAGGGKDAKDAKDAAAGGASGGKDDNGTSDWDGLKRDLKHVFDP